MSSVVLHVAGNYGVVLHRNACATVFGTVQIVSATRSWKHSEDLHFMSMMKRSTKMTKVKNAVKDLARGSGNRVADGAMLLQEGNDPADHGHVRKQTPLQTKAKELADDMRYRTELVPDINQARQQRTTRLRRAKDVRPL
jgi:hypothetical protein